MNKQSKNSRNFIFLQFLDAEINSLLSGLMREFGSSKAESNIHITVRGPYPSRISEEDIAKFERIVRNDPILIHGIDVFRNQTENVVYIRVYSDSLKKIWWKPDFPVEKFGFNPHISLHKTPDGEFAKTITDFLKNEDIKSICHDFRLIPFASKQGDLFPLGPAPGICISGNSRIADSFARIYCTEPRMLLRNIGESVPAMILSMLDDVPLPHDKGK